MNKLYKSLMTVGVAVATMAGFSSCEDYLDKEPASDVSASAAFKDFTNMQGYVEEIYNCIPDKAKCYWTTGWNLGDDEIQNPQADEVIVHQIDLGNFFAWQTNLQFWFAAKRDGLDPSAWQNGPEFKHRLYGHAWYCISKCNTGIAHIDEYFQGTAEEKNLILGQLYFFRAWWHFEMMEYLGGLPYINEELPTGESPRLVRNTYLECAELAAADFKKASELLPVDWDKTAAGKRTLGKNDLRINKITALAYLGKNYLWAASPLMQHGAQKGGAKTYSYDQELAQKAADAFGEIINMVESGQTTYEFAKFDYSNVYDHEKSDGVEWSYSELFFTHSRSWIQPGGKEAIMRGPSQGWSFTRYNYTRLFGPNQLCTQDNHIHQPTANYVANYGMANGLPLDDPESGFDINHPFKDRDPRFYHDIIFDGIEYIKAKPKDPDAAMKYAGLATGGSMRAVSNASRTGYFYQKLVPHQCQSYDCGAFDDYAANPNAYIPYMRLADVYLMYAEATAVLGGQSGKSSKCSLTSVDAINRLRDRVGAGHVSAKFTGNAYMDEVRRERAVELAFEGFRFNDLQRWLLLTEPKYTVKTSAEFKRLEDESFFAENDPAEARIGEYHEEVILNRNFDTKHYWFPLLRDDTYIYAEFEQNPGW